jgi:hypothetical protein
VHGDVGPAPGHRTARQSAVILTLAAIAVLPFVVASLVVGFRSPARVLLPAFALTVPFGSGLALPGLAPRYASASSLLMVALLVAVALKLVTGQWRPRPPDALVATWLLVLGVAGATAFWSVAVAQTVAGFLPFVGIVALYVLLRLAPLTRGSLRRTEVAVLVGGVAVAVYGVFQFSTSSLPTSEAGGARFGRDLLDPNHTAAALTLPLAIALGRASDATLPRLQRLLSMGVVVLLLTAVVLTGSRGGLLAAAVVLVVSAATGRRRWAALTAVVLAAVGVVLVVQTVPGLVPARLMESGSSGRTDIWRVGAAACTTYCDTGSGWGTFGEVYADTLPGVGEAAVTASGVFFQPHNVWLLAAVETGILGLVLMTTGLALAVREAVRLPAEVRGPPLAALLGLLTSGVLLSNLEFKYFWMVLIFAALVAGVHARTGGAGETAPETVGTFALHGRTRSSAGMMGRYSPQGDG